LVAGCLLGRRPALGEPLSRGCANSPRGAGVGRPRLIVESKDGVNTATSVAPTRRADVICKSVTIVPPARALSVVTLKAREEG
jgi:hypothetical protein